MCCFGCSFCHFCLNEHCLYFKAALLQCVFSTRIHWVNWHCSQNYHNIKWISTSLSLYLLICLRPYLNNKLPWAHDATCATLCPDVILVLPFNLHPNPFISSSKCLKLLILQTSSRCFHAQILQSNNIDSENTLQSWMQSLFCRQKSNNKKRLIIQIDIKKFVMSTWGNIPGF